MGPFSIARVGIVRLGNEDKKSLGGGWVCTRFILDHNPTAMNDNLLCLCEYHAPRLVNKEAKKVPSLCTIGHNHLHQPWSIRKCFLPNDTADITKEEDQNEG